MKRTGCEYIDQYADTEYEGQAMDYTQVSVTVPASDTLKAYDEIVEWEADDDRTISDATARAIAGWYGIVLDDTPRRLLSVVYAVGRATRGYLAYPDAWSAGDVLNLNALDAWCDSKRAVAVVLA